MKRWFPRTFIHESAHYCCVAIHLTTHGHRITFYTSQLATPDGEPDPEDFVLISGRELFLYAYVCLVRAALVDNLMCIRIHRT